jgi:hypothetical protein
MVTRLVRIVPTLAYAKGETYSRGPRSSNLVGKTGVWLFSTQKLVASQRLIDHIEFLFRALVPDPTHLARLHHLIERNSLTAVMTCYWYGRSAAKRPSLPRSVTDLLELLPASLETDFRTEGDDRQAA